MSSHLTFLHLILSHLILSYIIFPCVIILTSFVDLVPPAAATVMQDIARAFAYTASAGSICSIFISTEAMSSCLEAGEHETLAKLPWCLYMRLNIYLHWTFMFTFIVFCLHHMLGALSH